MTRVEGSKLGDRFIEYLALDAVIRNLERNGWNWQVAEKRNQKGFDLIASKPHKKFRIEVKGRSLGEYSGIVNESTAQKKDTRRHFNFSQAQYAIGDFFVPVFVSPEVRHSIVVPKQDFDSLRTSNIKRYRMTFAVDKNLEIERVKKWRDGNELISASILKAGIS